MKKFLEFLASKGISDSDFKAMEPAEQAKLYSEHTDTSLKTLSDQLQKAVTEEGLSTIKEGIEELKETVKSFVKSELFNELDEQVKQLKENGGKTAEKLSLKATVKGELLKNVEAIAKMKENKNESVSMTLKAVGDMTFATNTTNNVGRYEREAGIEGALVRQPVFLSLVNTRPTNAHIYSWVEKTGKEGGVTMVAEGAVKPKGDFNLVEYTQKPKKDALIITVSKEMLDDIDGMAQEVTDEIYEQIELFTDDAVLDGDGTGNNIVGLDANATAFVAGTFGDTVVKANNMDAIRVAINQVYLNNDIPTAVLMHPSDATAMELEKIADGRYIIPPFVSAEGVSIKGVPVVTSAKVTQDEAYVGNFKRFQARIRENIVLEMGYKTGDWEKNFISFLGEQRFFGFIKAVHYGSIVKLDFTAAKALLDPSVTDPT